MLKNNKKKIARVLVALMVSSACFLTLPTIIPFLKTTTNSNQKISNNFLDQKTVPPTNVSTNLIVKNNKVVWPNQYNTAINWDDQEATTNNLNDILSGDLSYLLFDFLPLTAKVSINISNFDWANGTIIIDALNVSNYYLNGNIIPNSKNFLTNQQKISIENIKRPATKVNTNQSNDEVTDYGKISLINDTYYWSAYNYLNYTNIIPSEFRPNRDLLNFNELQVAFDFLPTNAQVTFSKRIDDDINGTISFIITIVNAIGIDGEQSLAQISYKFVLTGLDKKIIWNNYQFVDNQYNIPLTNSLQLLDKNSISNNETKNTIIQFLNNNKELLTKNIPDTITFKSLNANWDDVNKQILLSDITLSNNKKLDDIALSNLPLVALDIINKTQPEINDYPSVIINQLKNQNLSPTSIISLLSNFFDGLNNLSNDLEVSILSNMLTASNSNGSISIAFKVSLKNVPSFFKVYSATFNIGNEKITKIKQNIYYDQSLYNQDVNQLFNAWNGDKTLAIDYLNFHKKDLFINLNRGSVIDIGQITLNNSNRAIILNDIKVSYAITDADVGVDAILGKITIVGFKIPMVVSNKTIIEKKYDYLNDVNFPSTPSLLANILNDNNVAISDKLIYLDKMVQVVNPAPNFVWKKIVATPNDNDGIIRLELVPDKYLNEQGHITSSDDVPFSYIDNFQLISNNRSTIVNQVISLPKNDLLKYAFLYTADELIKVDGIITNPLPPNTPDPIIKPDSLIYDNRNCTIEAILVLNSRYDSNGNIENGIFEYPIKFINAKAIAPTSVIKKNDIVYSNLTTDELISELNNDKVLVNYIDVINGLDNTLISSNHSATVVEGKLGIVKVDIYLTNYIANDYRLSFHSSQSLDFTTFYFATKLHTQTTLKNTIEINGINVVGELKKYLATEVIALKNTNMVQRLIKEFIVENYLQIFNNYPDNQITPVINHISDIDIQPVNNDTNAINLTFSIANTYNELGEISVNQFNFNINNFQSPGLLTTIKTNLLISNFNIDGIDANTYTNDIFNSQGANQSQNNLQTKIVQYINDHRELFFDNYPQSSNDLKKPAIKNYIFSYTTDTIVIECNILSKQLNPNADADYTNDRHQIIIGGFNTRVTKIIDSLIPSPTNVGLDVFNNSILSNITPSTFINHPEAMQELQNVLKGQLENMFVKDTYSNFFISVNKNNLKLVDIKDENDVEKTLVAVFAVEEAMTINGYDNLTCEIKISGLGGLRELTTIKNPIDISDKKLGITYNNQPISSFFAFDVIDSPALQAQIIASINDTKKIDYYFNNPINPSNIPTNSNIIRDDSQNDWKLMNDKNSVSFNADFYSWSSQQNTNIPEYINGNFNLINFSTATTTLNQRIINVVNSEFSNYTAETVMTTMKEKIIKWLNDNYSLYFINTPLTFNIDDIVLQEYINNMSSMKITIKTNNIAINGEKVDSYSFKDIIIEGFNPNNLISTYNGLSINLQEITEENAFLIDYNNFDENKLNQKLNQIKKYLDSNLQLFITPVYNSNDIDVVFNDDLQSVNVIYNGYKDGNVARLSQKINLVYQENNSGAELNSWIASISAYILKDISPSEFEDEDAVVKKLENAVAETIKMYIDDNKETLPIVIIESVKNGIDNIVFENAIKIDDQNAYIDTTKVFIKIDNRDIPLAGNNAIFSALRLNIKSEILVPSPTKDRNYWIILAFIADAFILIAIVSLCITAFIRNRWKDEDEGV